MIISLIIIGAVTVAIAAAGAYLRWASTPVLVAYHLGKHVERTLAARRGGQVLTSLCQRI